MKMKIITIVRSLGVLFALTILFSLVFAALYYFNVISGATFHMLHWIFGVLSFLASGIVLGFGIQKKALLHAFGICIILALFGYFTIDSYTFVSISEFTSKLLCYVAGSVLGCNVKNKT